MKKHITWVVVADGAHASIFQNDGPGKGIKATKHTQLHGDNRRSSEIASDAPGQVKSRTGISRRSMAEPTDPHRHAKHEFVEQVAEILSEEQRKGAFERLILVAPPQALGDLRAALSSEVAEMITGELNKDLTHLPMPEIADHLGSVLAV